MLGKIQTGHTCIGDLNGSYNIAIGLNSTYAMGGYIADSCEFDTQTAMCILYNYAKYKA